MPDGSPRWMTVPRVQDPIQRQQAALLHTLLLAILAIAGLVIVLNIAMAGTAALTARRLLPSLILMLSSGVALLVLRRGEFVWAVRIITGMFLLILAHSFLTAPFSATRGILSVFVIPITLAGLLLGRRALVTSTLVSMLVAVAAHVRDTPAPDAAGTAQQVTGTTLMVFILTIGLFALFLDQFGSVLRSALATALQREQDAYAQRSRFEVTLSSIGDAVISTDAQGRVSFMNPVAEHLTGWTLADALGKHLDDVFVIVNERSREPVESPVTLVLRKGQIVGLANHTVLIAKDGTEWPIDDSGAPIRNAQGAIGGVVLVFHDITARRHAEAVLGRYQLLADHAKDAILFVRLDGRIVEANKAAVMLYGYSYEELLTMRLHDLRDPSAVSSISAHLAQAQAGDAFFETVHRRKDGTLFPVEVSAAGAEVGSERLVIDVVRDITQRRQAEHERGWLAAIVESSDDAIASLAADGSFLSWNPGAERMFGYTAEEIIGRPAAFLAPDERKGEVATVVAQFRRGAPVQRYETERMRRDGTFIPIAVSVSPILGVDGQVQGASIIARDISARKRWANQQRFLVEASTILAGSLDFNATLDGLARLAVPFIADWCAVDMPSAGGGSERVAVAHVDPAKVEMVREAERRYPPEPDRPHPLLRVLEGGKSEMLSDVPDALLQAIAKDEEHLRLMRELGLRSWMCVPLVVKGHTLGAITLATADSGRRYTTADLEFAEDLARRAAVAVENARLYREAQNAIRARDTFLSIASHELKTPLTGLIGYLQLLQRRVTREQSMNERDHRALRIVGDQARRLELLVDEMLDISRIETGLFSVDRAPMDLAALSRRVAEELEPTLQAHTLALEVPEVPVPIRGDERRLEQVLQNLLGNAIKYSPDGGQIGLRITPVDGYARLEIRDEGLGIPEAELEHLFQRFYRAANVDHVRISGFGLGLYLVQQIVSRHDGTVEVTSTEGQGSTFAISLPLDAGQDDGGTIGE